VRPPLASKFVHPSTRAGRHLALAGARPPFSRVPALPSGVGRLVSVSWPSRRSLLPWSIGSGAPHSARIVVPVRVSLPLRRTRPVLCGHRNLPDTRSVPQSSRRSGRAIERPHRFCQCRLPSRTSASSSSVVLGLRRTVHPSSPRVMAEPFAHRSCQCSTCPGIGNVSSSVSIGPPPVVCHQRGPSRVLARAIARHRSFRWTSHLPLRRTVVVSMYAPSSRSVSNRVHQEVHGRTI